MLPHAHRRLLYLQEDTRLSGDPDEHVLKGPKGQGPISQDYLSRRFRFFCKKAGLSDVFDLYSLIHFFGTERPPRTKAVGLDLGLAHAVITSDGQKIDKVLPNGIV